MPAFFSIDDEELIVNAEQVKFIEGGEEDGLAIHFIGDREPLTLYKTTYSDIRKHWG